MTYEISATFNVLTMRKIPGTGVKAIGFYIQYTMATDELNELGIVVNQDFTMDLHRDVKRMLESTLFLQADDPDLDTAAALAAGVVDTVVLDNVDYPGLSQFLYDELATRTTDGCLTNRVWVHEIIVQGSRFKKV